MPPDIRANYQPDRAMRIQVVRAVLLADALAVLAVAAVGQAVTGTGIPEIAGRRLGQVALVIIIDTRTPGVGQVPVAADVIGVVGHGGPGMAVTRDLAVAIEIVQ